MAQLFLVDLGNLLSFNLYFHIAAGDYETHSGLHHSNRIKKNLKPFLTQVVNLWIVQKYVNKGVKECKNERVSLPWNSGSLGIQTPKLNK